MGAAFALKNWDDISMSIRIREGLEKKSGDPETLSLIQVKGESISNGYGATRIGTVK
jgi:hypothetical protein